MRPGRRTQSKRKYQIPYFCGLRRAKLFLANSTLLRSSFKTLNVPIVTVISNNDSVNYIRKEEYNPEVTSELIDSFTHVLQRVGEDPAREGLLKTPERAAKAMQFLTSGYHTDPAEILKSAMFSEEYSEMVLVKDIELYSLCEHHILPFFGKAHIAYIPNGYIVGLSKIPRVVDVFARRLQVQERLTHEILNCLQEVLQPLGAAIVIEARHMCMMMRGVQKQNSVTTTSAFTGEFRNEETRSEFLNLISSNLH